MSFIAEDCVTIWHFSWNIQAAQISVSGRGTSAHLRVGEKKRKRPKEVEDDGHLEEVGEVMEGCQSFLSYFQSSSNLHVSMPTEDSGNIPNDYTGTWMKPLKHWGLTFINYGMRTETMTSLG